MSDFAPPLSGNVLASGEIVVTSRVDLRNLSKAEKEVEAFKKRIESEGSTPALKQGLRDSAKEVDRFRERLGLAQRGLEGLGEKSRNPLKVLSEGIANADKKLADFGISFRGVSILLGAGLATGIVGVVRILEQFGQKLAEEVINERELESQTRLTFGNMADEVEAFGHQAEQSLSLSREEALGSLNAFGLFARTLRFSTDEAAALAEGLTTFAALVRQTEPGFKTLEDVQAVLEDAIGGSDEALARLGLTTADLREESERLFGRLPAQLGEAERAVVIYSVGLERASEKTDELADRSTPVVDLLRGLRDAAVDFTSAFIDGLNQDLAILEKVNNKIVESAETWRELFRDILDKGVDIILGGPEDEEALKERFRKLTDAELEEARRAADILGNTGPAKLRRQLIEEEIERRKENADAIEKEGAALDKLAASAKRATEAKFLGDPNKILEVVAAFERLDKAREDGRRRIEEAEIAQQRVVEDNARKERDVRLRIARDAEDAAEAVIRAERGVEEAREQNRRSLEDAQLRVDEAREKAFRANRKAQEDLEDFDRRSSRRIIDLRDRVAESHRREAEAILAAQLAIGQAILHRNGLEFNAAQLQLHRAQTTGEAATAERDLQRELIDNAIERERLEREVEETRLDGIRDVDKAVRDQQRAEHDAKVRLEKAQEAYNDAIKRQTRATEDAINALNDLEVEQNRALFDARRRIEEAERAREEAVKEASRALQKLANDIDITIERLRELIHLASGQVLSPDLILAGLPGRMAGGAFTRHDPFWAGEGGFPELIFPETNGRVISNAELRQLFAQSQWNRDQLRDQTAVEPPWMAHFAQWIAALIRSHEQNKPLPPIIVNEAQTPDATVFGIIRQLTSGFGR